MSDQWRFWRDAVAGTRIETERGNPRSGYYRNLTGKPEPQHIEAICIYRDATGALQCIRNVYGDGSNMSDSEIDDLFGKVCMYPIAEATYFAVTRDGAAWPPEYGAGGRLTGKDQQAGVAWTPEYGRRRLGLAENPRATIGGNMPPEPTDAASEAATSPAVDPAPVGHTHDGPQTPDMVALAEVSGLAADVKVWLAGIGGAPRNKAEADTIADYATKFGGLAKRAEDQRVAEKKPHLEACKEVDTRWERPIANAKGARKRCLDIGQAWRDAEDARRAEDARKANEMAAQAATAAGRDAPPPVEAEKVGGIGNIRTVTTRTRDDFVVTDLRAYLTHLLAQAGDLPGELAEAAAKVARRRAEEAPGVEKQQIRSAA